MNYVNVEHQAGRSHSPTLAGQVETMLSTLGYRQFSSVRCRTDGDHIYLNGRLNSFYLKQIAQTIAMKVPGVRLVTNEIDVSE